MCILKSAKRGKGCIYLIFFLLNSIIIQYAYNYPNILIILYQNTTQNPIFFSPSSLSQNFPDPNPQNNIFHQNSQEQGC